MIHSWLLAHKRTLQSLDFGYLSGSARRSLFNASDFLALKVLKLSRWEMPRELRSPVTDADALLAPNLRTFGWSFSINDEHCESWDDFGDTEENWLRGFAKTAIARKAALDRIEIEFNPYESIWDEETYPWNRLDSIRDEILPYGITLKYSMPQVTKEEWLEKRETWANGLEDLIVSIEEQPNEDLTGSEISDSESSNSEFTCTGLDDPNAGRDIREFFLPV